MKSPFESYIRNIEVDLRDGKATEHTYRPVINNLIEILAPDIKAFNDPKHIACGAPDFIVERRKIPLGYIETKDIGVDLDKVEKTDQLKRYRQSLNNLILTDYLEFRWYVNGQHKLSARIASIGKNNKLIIDPEGITMVERLFDEFFQMEVPIVETPRDLAERMAQLAKLIRDLTLNALQTEEEIHGALHKQYRIFKEYLLPNLTPLEFADIYAQTMAYGLFAACISAPINAQFSRSTAYQYLSANRFLRKLFLDVGEELENTLIAPFLDDISSLLAHANLASILKDFGKRTRTEDPVVHFYETFLAAYDPKLREGRGVYYTPEPAVKFIINSVDLLLKQHFNLPLGLASDEVFLLDPATGTSTFLYFAIKIIYDTLVNQHQGGIWQQYVHKQLLPRIFGFELLVAPYVIAHIKLGLLLKDLGYKWEKEDRLRVFLTNALDEGVTQSETLGDLSWYISQEASEAAQVKKNTPIMVIVGNPPYSGLSANSSVDSDGKLNFIGRILQDYYQVDGKPLGERKLWLQDDYVKFIRFAQWRIEETGHGIVAFITNHGYLDNPTFRGMRQNLLNSFNEIYVLNLHGNSKKKEHSPDGSKDENIFDIQQGVAILLAIRTPLKKSSILGNLYHADIWGKRNSKYKLLEENNVHTVNWKKINPVSPEYLFIPEARGPKKEYEQGWKITEIMPINVTGVVTARDKFVIDYSDSMIENKINTFLDSTLSDKEVKETLELSENYSWRVEKARKELRAEGEWKKYLNNILYRPFDTRRILFHPSVVWRTRPDVMPHMLAGENIGLIATRQTRDKWDVLATQFICGHKSCAAYDINSLFPLYLYTTPEDTNKTLFKQTEITREPNLSKIFIKLFSEKLGLSFLPDDRGNLKNTFGPEDILNYAYAIFYSPTYRKRYSEYLKKDFPRLPFITDIKLFNRLVSKGKELVSLHLLISPLVSQLITTFPISGNNIVERITYQHGKVLINASQYFGGVTKNVWEYYVGGYQVCEKWLKDRKGKVLTNEDISHYQKIIIALKETIRIMIEIDDVIESWPIK